MARDRKVWFRVHVSILHSRKIQTLPPALFKWLVNLWALAANNNGALPSVADIAWTLHCTESVAESAINDLVQRRLIDRGDESNSPHDWKDWQYESDNSTERVKRFRDRKIREERNGDETLHETPDSETGNVTETPPDTETDQNRIRAERAREKPGAKSGPIPIREVPRDAEARIRLLAEAAPDQQFFEPGIEAAIQQLISAANPESEIAAMEQNLPLWWAEMLDGRARLRCLLYVIRDRDYLRPPRPVTKTQNKPELWRDPFADLEKKSGA